MAHDTTDTSVLVSLQELVSLEHERLREEERERELAREEAEQARRLHQEQERAAEEARQAAVEEARRARQRGAAEEAARLQALEQAEILRARIEAEAAASREREALEHRHRSELAKLQTGRYARRWRTALVAGVLATALAGGAVAMHLNESLERARIAQDARGRQLAEEQQRYLGERLAVLDRVAVATQEKLEALNEAPAEVADAAAEVRRLRAALEPGALEPRALDALERAQQALAEALGRSLRKRQLQSLDALYAELHAAAAAVRRPPVALSRADARAEALRNGLEPSDPDGAALERMARALEELAREVAQAPAAAGVGSAGRPAGTEASGGPCDPHDPMDFCLPGR